MTKVEKLKQRIEELEARIDRLHEHDGTMCPICAMERRIEELEAVLEKLMRRGLEIISEHVGGTDASYVAQELTALASHALEKDDE